MWLKIPWPKCKEGIFHTFHVCGMSGEIPGPFLGRVERFQGLSECRGMYHWSISVGGGWHGKISIPYVDGTRFQCPGIEVGLRFQDPFGGVLLGNSLTNVRS